MEGETIGQIKYQATWIYNKSRFLSELLASMKAEKEDLIEEIKAQDNKMQIISKPFGGYRNILEIDDIHFEDAFLTKDMKEFLKVTDKEQEYNITFNMVANKMGLKNTRWARLTIIMFGVWAVLTSVVCFEKPDFLNVSTHLLIFYQKFVFLVDNCDNGFASVFRPLINEVKLFETADLGTSSKSNIRFAVDIPQNSRVLAG